MMNVGGYHEYIGGCSVHRRDTMSTSGGYHEYIGGCSVHRRDIMIHVGEQLDTCTHDITPMYSWYPPDVLMVSPHMYHDIPPMY